MRYELMKASKTAPCQNLERAVVYTHKKNSTPKPTP